ncbi:MAG: hypothetical protein J1F31_04455 [Erysipelotrichales bacterium]|nr:hypothetical protein [Erysipelotrichales bacterium]
MKKYSTEISFHPLTVLYIALSLILGRFSFVFDLFVIAFIHELFHVFAARIFNLKISEISFLPIGCYAKISDLEHAKRGVQIIVLLLGPLSFFFTRAIITFLYRNDIISIYGFREFNEINLFMMVFNLLPIFPFDGGRILKIVISSLISEKKSLIITSLVGILMSSIFVLRLLEIRQYLFAFFIVFYAIKNIVTIKKDYKKFLIMRYISREYENYKIKINNRRVIYRYAHNFYLIGNNIYPEEKVVENLLKK